eukprot:COSAG01_NODE_26700_length_705_cov_3.285479_1_plen_189_part_01
MGSDCPTVIQEDQVADVSTCLHPVYREAAQAASTVTNGDLKDTVLMYAHRIKAEHGYCGSTRSASDDDLNDGHDPAGHSGSHLAALEQRVRRALAAEQDHDDEITTLGWVGLPELGGQPANITTGTTLSTLLKDLAHRLKTGELPQHFDWTGGHVWMSAVLLQSFMSTDQGQLFVQGRRCVELGTGTGA